MRILITTFIIGILLSCSKDNFQEREWMVGEDDMEVIQSFEAENDDVLTLQLVSEGFCLGGSFLDVTIKSENEVTYQETIKELDATIQFSIETGKNIEVKTTVVTGDGSIQCVRLGNVRCMLNPK